MQRVIFIAITILVFTPFAFSASIHPRLDTRPNDINGTILEYDPETGSLWAYLLPEATKSMTTIEIISESEIVAYEIGQCRPFGGLFDVYNPNKIFKLDPAGFKEFHCENGLQTGLTHEFVANDLRVDGALSGGGPFSDVILLVPEPTSVCGIVLGLFVIAFRTRRRTS